MTSLVVTIVGPDRLGIVGEISDTVYAHEGNWRESHMANLAGQFAGIVRLDVAEAKADALTTAFESLEKTGLKVVVQRAGTLSEESRRRVKIEIIGNDRPGIVKDISGVAADLNVSIEEFESESVSRSQSGDLLFKANAELLLPKNLSTDDLNERIQDIANDIMVDVVMDND